MTETRDGEICGAIRVIEVSHSRVMLVLFGCKHKLVWSVSGTRISQLIRLTPQKIAAGLINREALFAETMYRHDLKLVSSSGKSCRIDQSSV